MSFLQLTSRFIELEKQLHEAVQLNDDQRIRDVDMQIELCFAQVLDYPTSDAFERHQKCAFLLERLCPAGDRQGIDQHICERILALASDEQSGQLEATAK